MKMTRKRKRMKTQKKNNKKFLGNVARTKTGEMIRTQIVMLIKLIPF